jgi:prophage antirepressor-like protein
MTEIQPFTFPATGQAVRIVQRDGEPWFVAADVADVLGYGGGARNAIVRIPERMKGVEDVNTPGGIQKMTVISESGAYRLVMRSNLPTAEAFQDWLAEDVIPAIRKTGSYSVATSHPLPRTFSEALRELADAVEQRDAAQERITELEPAADAWEKLAEAKGDYSLREAAQILSRDPLISTGQNRLAAYLREIGWVDSTKQPYQREIDNGRLGRRTRDYFDQKHGETKTTAQIRITVKGLKELRSRMAGQRQLIVIEGGA